MRNAYTYHLSEIFFTVVNEYTDWERTVQHPINTRDAAVAALSDAQFVAPLVQTGDLLSAKPSQGQSDGSLSPRTYFYVFDYQTKDGDYPQVILLSKYFFTQKKLFYIMVNIKIVNPCSIL